MADRARGADVDRIRDYVRAEVKRTSLRKVAAAAGVKLGATKKFVDGSVPYERNLRQWKRYYARQMQEGRAGRPDDSLPAEDAAIVLDMLLWSVPEERRAGAVARLLEAVRAIHAEAGTPPPRWVLDLLGPGGE